MPNVRIELTAFRLLGAGIGLWDERSAYWANRARYEGDEKYIYKQIL